MNTISGIIIFLLFNFILYSLPIISIYIPRETILTYHVWLNILAVFYILLPKKDTYIPKSKCG
jgi:hypothetical protein